MQRHTSCIAEDEDGYADVFDVGEKVMKEVMQKIQLILIHKHWCIIVLVTHKAVRPGARPHVPPVMAEGDFRSMIPLYDNLQ